MYKPVVLLALLSAATAISLPVGPRRLPDEDGGGMPPPRTAGSQVCTVAGDNVRYRTCPCAQQSCTPLGQKNMGDKVTIVGQRQGTIVDGVHWWGKTDQGHWISGKYLDCDGELSPCLRLRMRSS